MVELMYALSTSTMPFRVAKQLKLFYRPTGCSAKLAISWTVFSFVSFDGSLSRLFMFWKFTSSFRIWFLP